MTAPQGQSDLDTVFFLDRKGSKASVATRASQGQPGPVRASQDQSGPARASQGQPEPARAGQDQPALPGISIPGIRRSPRPQSTFSPLQIPEGQCPPAPTTTRPHTPEPRKTNERPATAIQRQPDPATANQDLPWPVSSRAQRAAPFLPEHLHPTKKHTRPIHYIFTAPRAETLQFSKTPATNRFLIILVLFFLPACGPLLLP
jgi:hypothetical protein